MKKLVLLMSMVLLTSCNSVLNPFQVKDTVSNYKTRLDVSQLESAGKDTLYVIKDIGEAQGRFKWAIDKNISKVIQNPSTKIEGLAIKEASAHLNIMLTESTKTLKQSQEFQIEKANAIEDRSQPKTTIKWYWWWIIGFVIVFLIGGAPAVFMVLKFMRSTAKQLGGLGEALVETMEKDEKIENHKIPHVLRKK